MLGVGFCLAWAYVFASRRRPAALLRAAPVALVLSCATNMAWSPYLVHENRDASRRMSCSNNLKQIVLALHSYHDAYKSFPPACLTDKNGQPMHSWRVLILPFLEANPLYQTYRFDEPWDGPNNSTLATGMPLPYACPSRNNRSSGLTSYVAVIGSQTAWPGSKARKLADFPDGTTRTVIVMEVPAAQIPWMEPRDLDLQEALDLLTSRDSTQAGPHQLEDSYFRKFPGRSVAFADGHADFVLDGTSREVWATVLTLNDDSHWDDIEEGHLKHARHLPQSSEGAITTRWLTLIALILLPIPWVWLNPQSKLA